MNAPLGPHLLRRACLIWLLGSALGCSGKAPVVARPAPPPSSVAGLSAGSTLTVPRPTPDTARLALWIDAGSRDAEPTQLATVAAWWAAQVADVSARVLPDGTEFTLTCRRSRDEVARCVEQLARVFAVPPPKPTDARKLRERLRSARHRAQADPRRKADEVAIETLFAEAARNMLPFGAEADDNELSPNAIVRFAHDHFVPPRALLIAAGDVTEAAVSRSFKSAAARVNARGIPRSTIAPALRSGVQVRAGDSDWLSLVMAVPSSTHANTMGQRYREIYTQAEIRIASLRGTHLLSVSMPAGPTPVRRLQRAVYDLRRLSLEAPRAAEHRPEESLENIVRLLGESWAARGESAFAPGQAWPIAAALVVRDAGAATESTPRLERIAAEAERAFAAAELVASGPLEGKVTAQLVRAEAGNGARVEVQRRAGDAWMAALVRFRGGSGHDPVTRHGRAALLTTLMTDGCGFAAGSALDARLAALDATLTPLVDAEHVGLLIGAPASNTEEAVDTVLRCALRPALRARAVDDARLKLLGALWERSDARLQAALGQLLSPTAPGLIAPWGTPDGISAVQLQELRRFHAELLQGRNLEIVVVADRPADELARFVSRRVAQLPAGKALTLPSPSAPPKPLHGELAERGPLRVVVGLRTDVRDADEVSASAFARLLAQTWSKRTGRVLWHTGAANGDHAWAGLALRITEQELAQLPSLTKEVLREVAEMPEARMQTQLQQDALARSAELSSARGFASAYFHGRASGRASARDALKLVRKLSQEEPAFFVLRPAP